MAKKVTINVAIDTTQPKKSISDLNKDVRTTISTLGQMEEAAELLTDELKKVEVGSAESVFKRSAHPYSYKLIGAFPSVIGPKKRLEFIPGTPPNLLSIPKGCRFHPRCPFATDKCATDIPEYREMGPGHYAKCHYAGELDLGGGA